MTGRLIRPTPVWAIAVVAFVLLGATDAAAGTLTLSFDAHANNSGCGIWGLTDPYGSYSAWLPTPPCGGADMGISAASGSLSGPATAGQRVSIQTTAPPGITINDVAVNGASINNINDGGGWGGGSFYAGGARSWHGGETYESDTGMNSSYWGFAMICGWKSCTNPGSIYPNQIQLTATENQGPSIIALTSPTANLWYQGTQYQGAGHYAWNPAGDPWQIGFTSSDPSGVCSMYALVENSLIPGPSASPYTSQWQQCPNQTWSQAGGASVDTHDYMPGAGSLPLVLVANNAAGVQSVVSETVNVDNDPVGMSLATPNDSNPSVWVNHAVTVDANGSAGPSGIGGISCSVDGGASRSYPAAGISVDGSAVHRVSCTAWNNAVDPQGYPNSSTNSVSVHIDETPPSLSFEPQDPNAPTDVVVDTSDSQSGIGGGSIAIAPAGTQNWTSLSATFDGQHVLSQINDAGLSGPYVIRATACDKVGNCASSTETMTMPLRIAADSQVSFARIAAPAKVVHRQVLVGWHWQRIRVNGRRVRLRVGGHFKTIRIVIRRNALCAVTRVRTGPHRWREIRACRQLSIRLVSRERVGYGKPVTVNGVLVSAQGVPIADAHVRVLTSPNNGIGQVTQAASVVTSANGAWTAKLPPGPSRTIAAVYDGSGRVLPAAGEVSVSVPARIALSISPRGVPWSGTVTIRGHLEGGYIPPDGVALRLLIRLPHRTRPYEPVSLRTDANGDFAVQWSWGTGAGVATYPFAIATVAGESDYPFAASRSRWIAVTFGSSIPGTSGPPHHHPKRRHHHKRRHR